MIIQNLTNYFLPTVPGSDKVYTIEVAVIGKSYTYF